MGLHSHLQRGAFVAAAAIALATGANASAASIIVKNASFEEPQLQRGTFVAGAIPGWSVNGGAAGMQNYSPAVLGTGYDGAQVAYLNAGLGGTIFEGEISQVTAESALANTLYTLSFLLGRRADQNLSAGHIFVDLMSGNKSVASASYTDSDLTQGVFKRFALTYSSTSAASDPLQIKFRSVWEGQTISQALLDDVRLESAALGTNSAVPEPSMWALLIMGFATIGAALRSKKTLPARRHPECAV